jgi:hypothetical protein
MQTLSIELRETCHRSIALLLITSLLSGCGAGTSAGAPRQPTVTAAATAALPGADASSPDGLDRCALLKDEEVSTSIGAHRPGSSSFENAWGLQSCRWTATAAQRIEGYPDGWFDLIEVAVFFKERESWAREQAKGSAVPGLAPGAVYDASDGELWFDCATRYCMVKAQTARPEQREHIARLLAQLVTSRLR